MKADCQNLKPMLAEIIKDYGAADLFEITEMPSPE
jgi:hypothetical protein